MKTIFEARNLIDGSQAFAREPLPGIVIVTDGTGELAVLVNAMNTSSSDAHHILEAIKRCPTGVGRHAPTADAARRHAGEAATKIEDVMIRARVLDAVDGWSAVLGKQIEATEEGALYDPNTNTTDARILTVKCPTTGRTYALRVPRKMKTVREARHWTLGLKPNDPPPEVET